MSKPPVRPARSLRFGTWPYKPRWLSAPVLDQAAGRDLAELTVEEATSVVEGLGLLQGVRAPVAAVPVLVLAAVLDQLGVEGNGALVMWVVTLSAVLVLPFYMIVLGVVQGMLKRSKTPSDLMASAHPGVLRAVGDAPFFALFLAVVAGVVLH